MSHLRQVNKRIIYIGIFVISIISLVVVQYYYLKIGINLGRAQFDTKVDVVIQTIKKDLSQENELTYLIASSLEEDLNRFNVTADSLKKASDFFLNGFIRYRLNSQGINNDFNYKLVSKDSSFYLKSTPDTKKTTSINYAVELDGYLVGLIDKSLVLELSFTDLNAYFLSQLNGLIVLSIISFLIIISVFVWVLYSVFWQHKVITTTNNFIDNLIHELKTPIFSIGLASKIIKKSSDKSDQKYFDIIDHQLKLLSTHINAVLELGSMSKNKSYFKLNPIDIKASLKSVCSMYEKLSEEKNFKFHYQLIDPPYLIKANEKHFVNAINNLIENAIKYSPEPIVELKAYRENKFLYIEIKDNGIGIEEKELNHIFKKYYRVPQGNIHNVKGHGIGLNYVYEVVKMHKGRIKIKSSVGKGTRVTLIFKLKNESV